jgi:hypothetical protein
MSTPALFIMSVANAFHRMRASPESLCSRAMYGEYVSMNSGDVIPSSDHCSPKV